MRKQTATGSLHPSQKSFATDLMEQNHMIAAQNKAIIMKAINRLLVGEDSNNRYTVTNVTNALVYSTKPLSPIGVDDECEIRGRKASYAHLIYMLIEAFNGNLPPEAEGTIELMLQADLDQLPQESVRIVMRVNEPSEPDADNYPSFPPLLTPK